MKTRSVDMSEPAPRAVVLDIEGTTTPIAFVYDVLFPFARRHLRPFLADPANRDALSQSFAWLRAEQQRDGQSADAPIDVYVESLMDQDRKSPGLKLLQGLIWEHGYRSGELEGEVFADVPPAFRRWQASGVRAAIYSSASELGQRLLFRHSTAGDLTPLLSGFFDTSVGAKRDEKSYRNIADALGLATGELLFLSDVTAELDAASLAGCRVRLCVRPQNPAQPPHSYTMIHDFDQLTFAGRG